MIFEKEQIQEILRVETTNKVCVICGNIKPINDFGKNNNYPDGHIKRCKICVKKQVDEYNKTKIGLINYSYKEQKIRSKNRRHPLPSYTKDELKDWCLTQEKFHKLYDNWVNSNYDTWLKPSIDRKDNNKGYSFDNIQLMTWKENKEKGEDDIRKCVIIHGANPQKAVNQFDLDGNFIKGYHSQAQAQRETGICQANISNACRISRYTAGGFYWSFSKRD